MHTISQLQEKVNKQLSELHIKPSPAHLYDPIKYMLGLEAKRTRPVLVLMSCELFGGNIDAAIQPAIGIEVFHNFTLLHDDIMDNAPLRRSQTTVHQKWNNNIAVLSGDAMFVKSCQLIMKSPDYCLSEVMDLFLESSVYVCEGQQLDMDFEVLKSVSIENYIDMIGCKTAVLLASSLKIGALIAKANARDSNHIYEFGRNIGIAFQLKDDLLDVFGDENLFGKQQGGDIISNKKTFLLLKALELSGINEKKNLDYWINKPNADNALKIKAIKDVYISLGIKEIGEREMEKYFNIAMAHLNEIDVSEERKVCLNEFAGKLMIREH